MSAMVVSPSSSERRRELALALAGELERDAELGPDVCPLLFAAPVRAYGRRVPEGIDNGERDFGSPYARGHGVTASDVVFIAARCWRDVRSCAVETSVSNIHGHPEPRCPASRV
jgi:hypothetical protein